MTIVNAIIRRALIAAICVDVIVGMWQAVPDIFVRVCATVVFSIMIAGCALSKLEAEPKRIPVVEQPAAPPVRKELVVDRKEICRYCGAAMGDLGRGIECESLFHHEIAIALLARKSAK